MTTSGAVLPPIGPDDTAEVPAIEAAPPPPPRAVRAQAHGHQRVVVVVAAGAGVGIWLGTKGSHPRRVTVTTQVVSVTTGTMKQTVSASGTIEPAQQASLKFAVSGQVTAVDVTAGQKVTAGQTLATVDPTALQAELDAAQATLTRGPGPAVQRPGQRRVGQPDRLRRGRSPRPRSQLTTAQTNLADANLTSTITGTVASVEPDRRPGGVRVWAGRRGHQLGLVLQLQVVVVGPTGSYVVTTTVDDTQVGQVKVGDQVDHHAQRVDAPPCTAPCRRSG